MSDYLVVYDIALETREDAKRLRQVAKICEGFGVRVQQSVFECRLAPTDREQLISDLKSVLSEKKDMVYIYPIRSTIAESRLVLGEKPFHDPGEVWIF